MSNDFFSFGFYAEILRQQVVYLSDPYLISADLYRIRTWLANMLLLIDASHISLLAYQDNFSLICSPSFELNRIRFL